MKRVRCEEAAAEELLPELWAHIWRDCLLLDCLAQWRALLEDARQMCVNVAPLSLERGLTVLDRLADGPFTFASTIPFTIVTEVTKLLWHDAVLCGLAGHTCSVTNPPDMRLSARRHNQYFVKPDHAAAVPPGMAQRTSVLRTYPPERCQRIEVKELPEEASLFLQ